MQEITVHKGECFEHVFVGEPLDMKIIQQAGSRVRIHVIDLQGVESRICVEQVGEGCKTEIFGLVYPVVASTDASSMAQGTIHTRVRHLVKGGESVQLLKFALDGHSKGDFFGELYIAPDAQQTSAQQTNRNLLLSEHAVMRTRPQLEIYADDVKASHGASTGQLDESSLFYMQQRCIDPETGRKLLLQAFLNEVVDTIDDVSVREDICARLNSALG